ncbi:MAG TPA: TatD family hydrolase [Candidatus Synoicihabitans sp.]|nr:TatD family hydrolase [Candidatus Synoicihabitans sp.]
MTRDRARQRRMYYDAHNHLQDEWLAPHLNDLVPRLEALPLGGAVVNGTHPDDWDQVAALARAYAWVRPSYGLHPWDVGRATSEWRERLEARLLAEPQAHIGEIGIDRWILDSARPDDPRLAGTIAPPFEDQVGAFKWQLTCAARHARVATIHCLQAWVALLDLCETTPRPARGFLLHAYGGSVALAARFAELGAYFSFNASFLDPRKTRHHAAFQAIRLDRLLVETDAPAMPPPVEFVHHPLPPSPTGERINSPVNIVGAYAGLAALRGVPEEALREQVAENFIRLFG